MKEKKEQVRGITIMKVILKRITCKAASCNSEIKIYADRSKWSRTIGIVNRLVS